MLIKKAKENPWPLAIAHACRRSRWTRRGAVRAACFFLFPCLLAAVLLYVFYWGARLQREHKFAGYRPMLRYVAKNKWKIPMNYFSGLPARPSKIYIDVKHMDMQRLAYFREYALRERAEPNYVFWQDSKAVTAKRDDLGEVPARITHDGETYDAKISLTGWTFEHYISPNKFSLKVAVKGGRTLMGMRRFGLLNVAGRGGGVNEWFCHRLSRKEGLLSLKTDFVDVIINGKDHGIFFLEESFDKYLMEKNHYRAGILFKPTIPMDILRKKQVLHSPALRKNMGLLDVLYKDFLDDRITAGALFDIKKMAIFYAITDLVNGFHQLSPDNMHLYFNPVTRLVEPIGREWETDFNDPITSICGELKNGWIRPDVNYFHHRMFADETFYAEYLKALQRISAREYLDRFFEEIDSDLTAKLHMLHQEYPYYGFDRDYFYRNQEYIRAKIHPAMPLDGYYCVAMNGSISVLLRRRIALPVSITSISVKQNGHDITLYDEAVFLKAGDQEENRFEEILLAPPMQAGVLAGWQSMTLSYRLPGDAAEGVMDVLPWPYADKYSRPADMGGPAANMSEFAFLSIVDRRIVFQEGRWTIDKDLVIPGGYTVVCRGSISLDLINGANIFSFSPLQFEGGDKGLIHVLSHDASGQGVTILNAREKSRFHNVVFENLSNPSGAGWELSGAVNFYESDVSMTNCVFSNMHAEDALNIIRSKFEITHTLFEGSESDAFDSDFCEGTIRNARFVDSGNDGIDISGSRLRADDILIDRAGDKAISVGENSRMSGTRIQVLHSEIGITSKDQSEVDLSNVDIGHTRVGCTAFQKKPEFGPGVIRIQTLRMEDVQRAYLIERDSTLIVDDEAVSVDAGENIRKLLYGAKYGKASK